MKNKGLVWICIICFLAVDVVSQPLPAPNSGASINELIDALDENSRITKDTGKKAEDVMGNISKEFDAGWGRIVLGVSMFIVLERGFIWFFSLLDRKRKKRSYESFIADLKEEQIRILEHSRDTTDVLVSRTSRILSELDRLVITARPSNAPSKWDYLFFLFLGGFIGFLSGVVL